MKLYHLIAFPKEWMNGQVLCAAADNKNASENDRLAFKEWKAKNQIYWYSGGHYRGTFDSKEKLVEIIMAQKDPWGLCEGYYEYLCIEPSEINCIDNWCEQDEETWFQVFSYGDDFKYKKIDRPKCLDKVAGFI